MKIDELPLDPNIINFLKSQGYTELYPPQEDAVKAGVLDGKSVLVSVPTASGKTLIAMLAAISHLSKNKSKVIYLTPLRALASEKFEEFKKSLATEDKVDLSNVKWSDIDTFEKFNNNFIKKYYRFGSIWKNTSILNKLGLAINHFENMKEFENDEFYNYVCEVFKKVQDTNVN